MPVRAAGGRTRRPAAAASAAIDRPGPLVRRPACSRHQGLSAARKGLIHGNHRHRPPTPPPSTAATSRIGLADDFDNFLQLLTTQLQSQDPLSPLDANQFTEQLVQFTGVEQAIKTNDVLGQLVALVRGRSGRPRRRLSRRRGRGRRPDRAPRRRRAGERPLPARPAGRRGRDRASTTKPAAWCAPRRATPRRAATRCPGTAASQSGARAARWPLPGRGRRRAMPPAHAVPVTHHHPRRRRRRRARRRPPACCRSRACCCRSTPSPPSAGRRRPPEHRHHRRQRGAKPAHLRRKPP